MGIRSISRVLAIPKTTVCRILQKAGESIERPRFCEYQQEYEIDELKTFIGSKKKECWICYAINRTTKQVVDFVVGRRTKKILGRVVRGVLCFGLYKIYTDKLNTYRGLVSLGIHSTRYRSTNCIERNNLTLRSHLKRLSRKTICFSRSHRMLEACLKLYFWRNPLLV